MPFWNTWEDPIPNIQTNTFQKKRTNLANISLKNVSFF
jgi:hypothetical protein